MIWIDRRSTPAVPYRFGGNIDILALDVGAQAPYPVHFRRPGRTAPAA